MTRLFCLISLIAGIFIGANSTGFLTHKTAAKGNPQTVTGSFTPPDMAKAASVVTESYYEGKLDSLAQTNSALGQQVVTAKAALQQTKHDNRVLRLMVDTLIAHAQQADTPGMLAHCDSIETVVQALIASSGLGDSLCESITKGLQAQMENKDSAMRVQRQSYSALSLSFDNSLARQTQLLSENQVYGMQIKQQKTKNKLLATGLAVMTGVAIYSFIRH